MGPSGQYQPATLRTRGSRSAWRAPTSASRTSARRWTAGPSIPAASLRTYRSGSCSRNRIARGTTSASAGRTRPLLAAVTPERVECAGANGRLIVAETRHELGDRVTVEEVVEHVTASDTHASVRMRETSLDGRRRGDAGRPEPAHRGPGAVLDGQVADESVVARALHHGPDSTAWPRTGKTTSNRSRRASLGGRPSICHSGSTCSIMSYCVR
jgi:hypothetical protein